MATLAEIRARIEAEQTKNQNRGSANQDNVVYPFWNIDEGVTASVRFLPDGDNSNSFFWVERQVIKLPFNGVKGANNSNQVLVQVPCMETWGENCPILAEVRPWYKNDSLKEIANKYWKKRSYIFQGFVRQNPLGDDVTPANPIRRFVITSQLFTLIKASLMDPELEELPTDYVHGLDFNIKKTMAKSGYPEYTTSTWARKETSLTAAEVAAIEAHGLYNLSDWLPKKPSESELRVIKEMFEASVDGQQYDADKWGAYYRPFGVDAPNSVQPDAASAVAAATAAPRVTTVVVEDDEPEVQSVAHKPAAVTASSSTDKAADILRMIRERQQAK